jgi:hypothetical protein
MTGREQAVLDALLSVEFDGVEQLRSAAQHVLVIGGCECGCPSIDFHKDPGTGSTFASTRGWMEPPAGYSCTRSVTVSAASSGLGPPKRAIRTSFPIPQFS